MSAFEYTALDAKGGQQKGVLEGDTARQVRQQMREKGWAPLTVIEIRQTEKRRKQSMLFDRGISATDLSLITRQFSTMVRAGLPIEEALLTLSKQTEKPRLKSVMMGVRAQVLEGHTLAQAMEDYPRIFPEYFHATVAAGEQSGYLDTVLERLADYTEGRNVMKNKVMLALIYPAILTVVAIGVVTALMAYVVPQVVQVFESMGQQLPVLTRGLIWLSDALRQTGLLFAVAIFVGVVAFIAALKKTWFKKYVHGISLRLPLIGRLTRGMNTARFMRTLCIMNGSGVPVLEGLKISGQVLENLPMRAAVEAATVQVREGTSLSVALDQSGYFPPMAIQLIASGEASGKLDQMLDRAAESQEREIETLVAALLGLFEPILILVMGGVVLLIVLAILLPIFDMNNLVR